jgi:hypothetical protein
MLNHSSHSHAIAAIGLTASIAMLFQFDFEVIKGGLLMLGAIIVVSLVLRKILCCD